MHKSNQDNLIVASSEKPVTSAKQVPVPSTFTPATNFNFNLMFPSLNSLLPQGVTYSDSVPDTYDLAERAARYIPGVTRTADPTSFYAPAAAALSPSFTYNAPGPRFVVPYWGAPNWGEVMLAMAQAREMSGFDRDNSQGTLAIQYEMMRNMFDLNVNIALGQNIVIPSASVTSMTYAMQALMKSYEQNPRVDIYAAIDFYIRIHQSMMSTMYNSGVAYNAFYGDLSPEPSSPQIGYAGPMYVPFIQGTALIGLEEWYQMTSDSRARAMSDDIKNFLLLVQGSYLWVSPNNSYQFAPGQGFAGHLYSWLEAVRGILMHAKSIQKTSPEAAMGYAAFAREIYQFVKVRTYAGYVGNFGSSGTAADMVIIGLLLSELGAGDYYDEVDAWTRNQLSQCEIDDQAASYIMNNNSSDWSTDHVGEKVKGLFFADATHLFSIPGVSQAFTSDDHAMAFRGIYEVWSKILTVNDRAMTLNFHLNYANKFVDVKSDVPYRGHVEIRTKANLGSIDELYMHIPVGTNRSLIRVSKKNSDGSLTPVSVNVNAGPYGNYALITGIKPTTVYVLDYPLFIWETSVFQLRDQSRGWYESSFPLNASDEQIQSWNGHFRGGTLVAIDSSFVDDGIPRYAEPWRAHLAALGASEVAAPKKQVTRFIYNGDISSLPTTEAIPPQPVATSSCKITQSSCPKNPSMVGTFLDSWNPASSNDQSICMQRAADFYNYCEIPAASGLTTQATFYSSSGQVIETKTVGRTACMITQNSCPKNPSLVGTFKDSAVGTSENQVSCMARASDYYNYCGINPATGSSTKAQYYSDGQVQETKIVGGVATSSCMITLTSCPSNPSMVGTFVDIWNPASNYNQSICMQRAIDYHRYCGIVPGTGVIVKASFYSASGVLVETKSIGKYIK